MGGQGLGGDGYGEAEEGWVRGEGVEGVVEFGGDCCCWYRVLAVIDPILFIRLYIMLVADSCHIVGAGLYRNAACKMYVLTTELLVLTHLLFRTAS